MLPMALDALLDVMTTKVDDDRLEKVSDSLELPLNPSPPALGTSCGAVGGVHGEQGE